MDHFTAHNYHGWIAYTFFHLSYDSQNAKYWISIDIEKFSSRKLTIFPLIKLTWSSIKKDSFKGAVGCDEASLRIVTDVCQEWKDIVDEYCMTKGIIKDPGS